MFTTICRYGNAVVPYRIVAQETFHTELAALLFGSMFCTEKRDPYFYWTLERTD